MLTNDITSFTLVLESARSYVELPKMTENVKYILIKALKYRSISPNQQLLQMKMSSGSGIDFNRNLYFSAAKFMNCVQSFYLGPLNSTTLYESSPTQQWTVKLHRPETIATLNIDLLIDGELANDISPANQLIISIDLISQ